jgi:Collagen triple helix repeat (20 copies)
MFTRLHKHFGTAGLVVAIVALIAAFGGAAIAAGGLTKPQEKQVTKIAKKYAGKAGPAGLAGPAGPAGLAGPAGPAGPKGDTGSTGATGPQGEPGDPGPEGPSGSPWTIGGVVPEGETLTGSWGINFTTSGIKSFPISFPIPLAEAPEPIIVDNDEQSKPGCPGRGGGEFGDGKPGNKPAIPLADPGKLCVYATQLINSSTTFSFPLTGFFKDEFNEGFDEWELVPGASQTGTILNLECTSQPCVIAGTWAVTAEEA